MTIQTLDVLLLTGVGSLLVSAVGFGLALWTRDRRTIAIGVSLAAVAVLLFVMLYMHYHVGKAILFEIREIQTQLHTLQQQMKLLIGMREQ